MNPFQFVADHVRNLILSEVNLENLPHINVVENGLVAIIDISGKIVTTKIYFEKVKFSNIVVLH